LELQTVKTSAVVFLQALCHSNEGIKSVLFTGHQ